MIGTIVTQTVPIFLLIALVLKLCRKPLSASYCLFLFGLLLFAETIAMLSLGVAMHFSDNVGSLTDLLIAEGIPLLLSFLCLTFSLLSIQNLKNGKPDQWFWAACISAVLPFAIWLWRLSYA